MPIFVYKVRDLNGKLLQGQMDAADARDLRRKLDDQRYFVVEFWEKRRAVSLLTADIFSLGRKVTQKELAALGWQLYTMLNAGLTLVNALKILENQTRNDQLKTVLGDVCQRVEEGNSFTQALSGHPRVFPSLFVQMVNAGEVGGVLDEMLKRLALFYERQDEIRTKVKSAMTYPAVLMVICVAVVVFMLTFILPRFVKIFDDLHLTLPLLTRLVIALSDALKSYWLLLLAGLAGCYVVFKGYTATGPGRYQFDLLKLKIPVVSDLIKKTLAARFTQTLSTLINGGIPILTALDVVIDTIGNSVVVKLLREVSNRVGEGKSIAAPLGDSRIFPDMVVNMVRVGEETGSLDKMLDKIADFYLREVDSSIEIFTRLLEPLMIVVMTAVIGCIAVAIFLPMADLMKGLHF